ncbi:ectonucleoside triphosphate diphosphohydrolase 5 isoform X3 [Bufo bufo]|uniref:ectonucleoside triphosphate diphosphohydrolase 5 isoform X3 n=1 Tax=Bufo bufo TaxID=8384 RepID=UPI001ABE2C9E|nr:ectonucleoside triphosphate diphosphohydrolase 5 isoform X3 [Bufo bufo]
MGVSRFWETMSLLLSAAFTLFLAFLPGDCSLDSFASRNVKSTSPSTLAMPSISCHTIYGIVFDAGSTGTRIHIYKFHQSDAGSPLELDGEIFESVKPGLSAFAGEPERGAESVRSLLHLAQDDIPATHWKTTPLVLKATAGLRLLPEHQAEALLLEVRKVFSSSPFLVPENSVSIMEGTDEGVLAWITVNFLTGRLHGDRSVGTLDLGGGSTQITFLPLAKATLDQSPGAFLTSIELFNSTYRLYTRSYLGLGLKAARLAVLGASVSAAQEKQIFRSPCFPAALDAEWTFAGVTYRYAGQADGLVGFDACYSEVLHILQGNVHQVDEMRDGRFYAFSYYYDRAVDTNLIEHEDGGALAVRDFALKAREVCDHMDRFASQSPFLCMDLTYITALLRDGFGFEEDTTLQLTKKVRDVETGWALGAIFLELQPLVHSG